MTLGRRTAVGVVWNVLEQLARRGVSVIVTLLLARFLVPQDFGLIAMMAVFIALGQSLMDSGFRQALIRMDEVAEEDYSTAFYANIALGLLSYGILYLAAPAISVFYEEPRLVDLIRVASLSIIVMSFQVVQVASLSRKLNFKSQLKASFPAGLVSGVVAVLLAYQGFGVWALVIQMLVNAAIHTILLWVFEGWRPTLQFRIPSMLQMYRFGYKLYLSGVIDTIFNNLYVIVIAKVFSASTAGLYFFANKIKDLIVMQLVQAIQNVTYPALASLQNDNVRLKQGYKKIISVMTFVFFPAVFFAAVLAESVFQILLPAQWISSVPFFQLLCLASILIPLHAINLNILKVKGRSDFFLYLEVIKKLANALMLCLTFRHGIYAILYGQIVMSIVNYIPNSYFSNRLLGYGIVEQFKDFMPALLIAAAISLSAFSLINYFDFSPVFTLLVFLPAMIAMFLIVNLVFNKKALVLIFNEVRLLFRSSRTPHDTKGS